MSVKLIDQFLNLFAKHKDRVFDYCVDCDAPIFNSEKEKIWYKEKICSFCYHFTLKEKENGFK